MNTHLGELAALTTAVMFSCSSIAQSIASQRVGSVVLNRMRLVLAVVWLLLAHVLFRLPLPFQAEGQRWLWLSLSGVVGLVLGDAFLFQAYIWIGARMTMLMMALAPALAGLLSWLFLGEALSIQQITGILLTMGGIGWVIQDRTGRMSSTPQDHRHTVLGLLCGLGAAAGQAGGMVLAKPGAAGDFPALSATLIRMIAATTILWGYTLLRNQVGATLSKLSSQRQAILSILLGSIFGPFLGVTFSIIAIQNAEVGIASTLIALPPVILLPVGYFFFKEKFGWQAVAGTLTAIAGVAVLFL